ncbi:unnamed protein product, partial [Allacma fusca]
EFDMKRIYEKTFPLEIMSEEQGNSSDPGGKDGLKIKYKKEILTQSFVFLMVMVFVVLFCQIAFKEFLIIYTQKYFGFSFWEKTFLFTVVTLEALVISIGIAFLGKYFRETTLQVLGWLLMVTALIWLTVGLPRIEKDNKTRVVYLLAETFVMMLGVP